MVRSAYPVVAPVKIAQIVAFHLPQITASRSSERVQKLATIARGVCKQSCLCTYRGRTGQDGLQFFARLGNVLFKRAGVEKALRK